MLLKQKNLPKIERSNLQEHLQESSMETRRLTLNLTSSEA